MARPADWPNPPETVEITGRVYTVRRYTPKRRVQKKYPGHGWVRAAGSPWQSEASAEVRELVDEVVRLRQLLAERGEP